MASADYIGAGSRKVQEQGRNKSFVTMNRDLMGNVQDRDKKQCPTWEKM